MTQQAQIDGLHLRVPFILPERGKSIRDKEGNSVIFRSMLDDNGVLVDLSLLDVVYNQKKKGNTELFEPSHSFESLPSHYSGLAFKIVLEKEAPYVSLFASPPKLIQGHNVYGFYNLAVSARALLNTLAIHYPLLSTYLNYKYTEILSIDVTTTTHIKNPYHKKLFFNYLRSVSSGQTKSYRRNYDTTIYWGSPKSGRKQLKIYSKAEEIQERFKEYKKKLTSEQYNNIINSHNENVMKFAQSAVRFEAKLKKKLLKAENYPTYLQKLAIMQNDYSKDNKCLILELWHRGFNDILQTLKGDAVQLDNDDKVYKRLLKKHTTITAQGKISTAKVKRAFKFYDYIKNNGYEKTRKLYSSSTFYDHIKLLTEAGYSLSSIQNLEPQHDINVVPIVRFFEVDLTKQVPDSWQPENIDNLHYLNIA